MTSYHPSIPQANDDPQKSQKDLLDNFSSINSQYAINHVPLTAGGKNGYHSQVWFDNVLDTDPNLTNPESSVYTRNISGTNELFFQNGNSFANVAQLTGLPVVNGQISGATQAVNCKITSINHGLVNGDTLTIYNVYGMTNLNQNTYTVVNVLNANEFTINVDSTLFPAYTGGGYWAVAAPTTMTKFAIVSPWGLIFNFGSVGPGVSTVNYAVPLSAGITYGVFTQPTGLISVYQVSAVSNTNFTILVGPNPVILYYLVIGK